MGRKKLSEKENTDIQIYRDPEATESDMVGMSVHFWNRFYAPDSPTKKWTHLQHTLFIMALGRIKDWRIGGNGNVVVLNNLNIMQELGWDFKGENSRMMSQIMRNEFGEMVKNCHISLQDAETGEWLEDRLIYNAKGNGNITQVTFNPEFMCHFENLYFFASNYQRAFLQISEPDIASFKCKYTHFLYQDLYSKKSIKKKSQEQIISYGIYELKKLLGLDDKDYMRNQDTITNEYSGFDYSAFEKKVLNPIITEINCSELVEILPWDDGKFYNKLKHMRKVDGYAFKFKVRDLETVRKERQALYKTALNKGKNPILAPNYKEEITFSYNTKFNWDHDTNPNEKKIIDTELVKENPKTQKRRDKIAERARDVFEVPEPLKDY